MINILIPGITAVITLAFASLVLIKSPRKRSNQLLTVGALSILICLLALIGLQLAKSKEMVILWSKTIFLGLILFPPIGIAFNETFLKLNFPELKRNGRSYVWIYLSTSLFFLLLLPGRGIVKNILLTQYGPIFEFTVFGKLLLIYFLLSLIYMSINLEPIFVSAFQNTSGAVKGVAISLVGALLFMIAIVSQMYLGAKVPFWMVWIECFLIAAGFVTYGYFEIQHAMNKVFLSSRMVYSSFLLLATGVYFLLLGISDYFVEYSNNDWRSYLFVLSILGIYMLFLMTLFSNKVKNRIESFWKRNVYQKKFDFREEWMLFSQKIANTLDLKILSDNMICHLGELFKINEVGLYLKTNSVSSYELIAACTNKSKFPKKLTLNGLFLDNLDLKLDSKDNYKSLERFFEDSFGGSFSTVVPLVVEGKILGILCIGDSKRVAQEILELLSLFADQAALAIHNIQITSKLIEVKELESVHRISSFVVHDLRNYVSMLSMILDNERVFGHDPNFRKNMLDTLKSTVESMKQLIAKISINRKTKELNKVPIFLNDVIHEVLKECEAYSCDNIQFIEKYSNLPPAYLAKSEIKTVIYNLCLNAIQAMPEGGVLEVKTQLDKDVFAGLAKERSSGQKVSIIVRDSGVGMSDKFLHNNIFHPFKSTKPNGLGIGLFQCKEIIESLSGQIKVESKLGQGTTFTISLPVEWDIKRDTKAFIHKSSQAMLI